MERIRLSRHEKNVLRLLSQGLRCPTDYPLHEFASAIDTLESQRLVKGIWGEGHKLVDARISSKGKEYLSINPNLCNPIDWKWIATTAIAICSIVLSIIACAR